MGLKLYNFMATQKAQLSLLAVRLESAQVEPWTKMSKYIALHFAICNEKKFPLDDDAAAKRSARQVEWGACNSGEQADDSTGHFRRRPRGRVDGSGLMKPDGSAVPAGPRDAIARSIGLLEVG